MLLYATLANFSSSSILQSTRSWNILLVLTEFQFHPNVPGSLVVGRQARGETAKTREGADKTSSVEAVIAKTEARRTERQKLLAVGRLRRPRGLFKYGSMSFVNWEVAYKTQTKPESSRVKNSSFHSSQRAILLRNDLEIHLSPLFNLNKNSYFMTATRNQVSMIIALLFTCPPSEKLWEIGFHIHIGADS